MDTLGTLQVSGSLVAILDYIDSLDTPASGSLVNPYYLGLHWQLGHSSVWFIS